MLLLAVFMTTVSVAQEIKNVEVIMTSSLQEEGELAYSSMPLDWADFKGQPDYSCSFAAMTYSGIRIKYEYVTRMGITTAKVLLCPYMDQSLSWFKKEGRTEEILEHEQRHFDITALIAEDLANAIRNASLDVAGFTKEIKRLHADHLEKLKKLQHQYDKDTQHGVLPLRQEAWNRYLSETLHRVVWTGFPG